MNFIDETINLVKAGNGGNGIVSFRREKYVPYGGPSGGNGGKGGSVIFIGDSGINTLFKLQYQKKIIASNGICGKNKNKNGSNAADLFIKVPLGTVVYRYKAKEKKKEIIGEILNHKQQLLIASGGKGGRGNYSLANSKNKTPFYAEKGDLGESFYIKTELKILADVGLIGKPNVGKSSLISSISNANSKISDYAFTTLKPFLGVVKLNDSLQITVADIPGLIKNSYLGKGMGISFLKHIERCKVLVHICSAEEDNIYKSYCQINEELKNYNAEIIKKKIIIVVNKIDIKNSKEKLFLFKEKLKENKIELKIIPISVLKKINLNSLKNEMFFCLKNHNNNLLKNNEIDKEKQEYKIFSLTKKEKEFHIFKDKQGNFVVEGEKINKLFHRTDLNNHESLQKFSYILKKMGVEEALKNQGMTHKDKVKICDYFFYLVK
ncbi:GTPase ObgE [Texas Phoenix palm phytoplasma]|uniref:GTPase Obg n=1 Tax=Texas Phoenix palm phytoplasma TaxID=176709 RepID=A0ABS5BIQ6_9MOLU|nr:GTPase ObgE [Texas Phoenix palm phytoplasma]MBP3059466.1 GTPase ObgE [Texas Phoenix palm phytoplasma]